MEEGVYKLRLLKQSHISPPSDSVPRTSLPLNQFDLLWLIIPPVQRVFFYTFQYSTAHFMKTVLPNLKQSLSLTLQHFYPLAGSLIWLPQSDRPEILYVNGDSILFTVAESDCEFKSLSGYHGRKIEKFYPLLPRLEPTSKTALPLLSLQVTIFPNSGICMGITISHVVADGKSSNHFMKSWASVCRLGRGNTTLPFDLFPVFDRTMIKDTKGYVVTNLKYLERFDISQQSLISPQPFTAAQDKVLATFVMGQSDIEKLKEWVTKRVSEKSKGTLEPPLRFSTFVVTCAYVWVCLIKTLGPNADRPREQFGFPMEIRAHVEPPLPPTYFGNCLGTCLIILNNLDLIDEDGVATAAEAMAKEVKKGRSTRNLAESVINLPDLFALASERTISVAGSPILRVYDTDFGWGKPTKVDIVSISGTGAISLSERSDGNGGLEVGMCLKKEDMENFASFFSGIIKNVMIR